ncbi:hypothetical protein FGB62_95g046 [Gracilaria domingensis]|nr:hypothetical protein FGB62_95g046 [Gracilaria domingensis]
MSSRFRNSNHKLANIEEEFKAYTPRGEEEKQTRTVLFNVSSGESAEPISNGDVEVSSVRSLAGMLERFNPTSPHRNSVLLKPDTKKCILVDEVDEECVSMKNIPRGFTRGRSGAGGFEANDGEEGHRARTRSTSRFRGYGREEEDKIIRRARARSVSRGIRLSWNLMTNEEYSELSSTELAKKICPEGFHRFRRVGPNSDENDTQNMSQEDAAEETCQPGKAANTQVKDRQSRDDFDLKFVSEVYRVDSINLDETGSNDNPTTSQEFRKQRKSKSVMT